MRASQCATAAAVAILLAGFGEISPAIVQGADQATEVLAAMRQALGGEEKLAAVQSLVAEGDYRRQVGERQMEGFTELTIVRPDRMRKIEEMSMGGMRGGPSIERISTLAGDRAWDESNNRSGGGGMFMMRINPGGPGGPGGENDEAAVERMRAMRMKAELQRYLLGFLGAPDVAVTHVGVAEAPDGSADVLEITDARNQKVRLFVDQKTRLPLMLTYQDIRPRMLMVGGPGGGRGGRRGGPGAGGDGQHADPEAIRRQAEAEGPPPTVSVAWRFGDYKLVDGIKLPHRIDGSVDNQPSEEITFKKFKVNPEVKADLFEKK